MTLLTVKQVADRLPYARSTVYDMIKRGEIPARRGGDGRGKIVVIEDELDEWIRNLPVAGQRGGMYDVSTAVGEAGSSLERFPVDSRDQDMQKGHLSRAL